MNARVAKKILKRWSRTFSAHALPREMYEQGRLPWSWATWTEAHRVWIRACRRRGRPSFMGAHVPRHGEER